MREIARRESVSVPMQTSGRSKPSLPVMLDWHQGRPLVPQAASAIIERRTLVAADQ